MGYPSLASEFPNDNTEISGGAIWVCAELTGPATAELAAYEPVPAERFVLYFEDDEPLVDGPIEVRIEAPERPAPEMPAAYRHFEAALISALMARGASRSAALVPQLLQLEALPVEALSKEVRLTLQSRGYFDGNARYSPKYRELCGAWMGVLGGASQDLAACGTTTLDHFGADLLAALLAVPTTRADELRRELRKAGVAAFGVLRAA